MTLAVLQGEFPAETEAPEGMSDDDGSNRSMDAPVRDAPGYI